MHGNQTTIASAPTAVTFEDEVTLFGSGGVPLLVRDQTIRIPSGQVRVAAVKVVFMLSGWGRVHSTMGEVPLDAGSVLTIPSQLECRGIPAEHMHTVTFYIHPEYLADQVRWLPGAHPLVHHLHRALHKNSGLTMLQLSAGTVRELTPTLLRLSRPPETARSDFAMFAGVSEVFDAVGKLTDVASGSIDSLGVFPRREVITAIALMRSHLNHFWRIDELAREVSLSPSQLTRLFRAQVGVPPAAFLRQLRADRMAEMLATTSITVGEAGVCVGWDNASVASRSFKQRYGVTPRAYESFYRGEEPAWLPGSRLAP